MDLLFYDIECFKYDSLVVFKRLDNSIYKYVWYSDNVDKFSEELTDVVSEHLIAGYNNYYYDDKMLSLMLRGVPQDLLKGHNDGLINGGDSTIILSPQIKSLDMMQQIDVSRPSLKQIEGNMGMSILESSIPFDIDRPLTVKEREEVLKYCAYDVEATIEIYKLRKDSYFTTKEELLKMQSNENAARWNTTSIIASILINKQSEYKRLSYIFLLDHKRSFIPDGAWNVWLRANKEDIPERASYVVDKFGCEVTFGFGGLHGAPMNPINCKDVKLLDVGSMYPSIIVLQEALGTSTEIYNNIRKERLSIKHSDPVKASALKLILNSTYGLLKNKYSMLYNPKASSAVCIYGQIALYDLCLRLDDMGYKIININTDGVAFTDPLNIDRFGDLWMDVQKEWEDEYKLTLELDTFDKWIQKDVNNYIATQGDHVKVKGGEVNKAFTNKFFSNNSARILDMGLVYALLHRDDEDWTDTKLLQYLVDNTDKPMLYQYILKAGKTFKGVYDLRGNKLQNVNRVFAYKGSDGTSLRKVRKDGGYVKFPDAPDNMYVWNGDVNDIKDFKSIVDINHYYQIIVKKLRMWK